MVRAILEGRKTQTRRVLRREKLYGPFAFDDPRIARYCPYGQPGDRLWVRETWLQDGPRLVRYRADGPNASPQQWDCPEAVWHPSIHMPRAYSRITLEITDVRVEQVQEVSEADAEAEGVTRELRGPRMYPGTNAARILESHQAAFARFWDAINAKRGYGWDTNPWVWVLTFKRAQP